MNNSQSINRAQTALMHLISLVATFAFFVEPSLAQTKLAFVVGIEEYQSVTMESLKYCEDDANDVSSALKSIGFDVTSVTGKSAKRESVDQSLKKFLDRIHKLEKNDITFVFLSGHGQQLLALSPKRNADGSPEIDAAGNPEMEEQEVPFLCAQDSVAFEKAKHTLKGKTVEQIEKEFGLVSINRIIEGIANQSNCFNNLIVVDACRNNPAKGKGIDGSEMRNFPPRISILFGAGSGERSYESTKPDVKNGVFTHYMLRGLRGEASDMQGRVTWLGLVNYVSTEVPENGWKLAGNQELRQSPQLLVNNLKQSITLATKVKRPSTVPEPEPEALADLKKNEPKMNDKDSASASGIKTKPSLFNFADGAQSESKTRVAQQAWAEYLGKEVDITNSLGMQFRLIPAGTFTMGSPESELRDEFHNEVEKQHQVTITKPYYLGKYEVTQSEFESVMGFNPSYFDKTEFSNSDGLPVEQVTWFDAVMFCNQLSQKDGRTAAYSIRDIEREEGKQNIASATVSWIEGTNGYRLPTEAEWEYACRAGNKAAFSTGGAITTDQANFNSSGYRMSTVLAKSFQPNAFGLHNMHGNVWEWCWDWYGDYPLSPVSDPTGAKEAGSRRVLRGGCWDSSQVLCRSAVRATNKPDHRHVNIGFRVALGL